MAHYTANVKLYWNGTAVNTTSGVLAFGVGDTVPDATVTRDGLATAGLVTSQPDGGTATPTFPVTVVGTPTNGQGPLWNTTTHQWEPGVPGSAAYVTVPGTPTSGGPLVQPHYNVKDYGAKGDGTTDDNAAIVAALAAAAGSVLVFPAGTYLSSASVNLPSNTTVRGFGRPTIKLKDASNANLLQCADTSGVVIRDLTLDGNGANQSTAGTAVLLAQHSGAAATDVQVIDCTVQNGKGYGIRTTGTANTGSRLTVRNCRVTGLMATGAIETQHDDDVLITECAIYSVTGRAIYVGNPAGTANRAVVTDNRINTATGMGIEIQAVTGAVVTGNSITATGSYGISLDTCNGAVCANNRVDNYAGVAIECVACDGASITGNWTNYTVGDAAGTGCTLTRSSHVSFTGNTMIGFGTDGIIVDGTVSGGKWVGISGCTFKGNNTTTAVGVRNSSGQYVSVAGCSFDTLFVSCRGSASPNYAVSGCTMDNTSYGAYMDGCNNARVTGCVMNGNANAFGNGITWTNTSTGSGAVNNRITGFTGASGGNGISVGASADYVTHIGNNTQGNRVGVGGSTPTNYANANNL